MSYSTVVHSLIFIIYTEATFVRSLRHSIDVSPYNLSPLESDGIAKPCRCRYYGNYSGSSHSKDLRGFIDKLLSAEADHISASAVVH